MELPQFPGRFRLFEQTPTLASAYVLRTLLTAIFDHTSDRATAQRRLQLWVKQVKASGLRCFDNFLNTFRSYAVACRLCTKAP